MLPRPSVGATLLIATANEGQGTTLLLLGSQGQLVYLPQALKGWEASHPYPGHHKEMSNGDNSLMLTTSELELAHAATNRVSSTMLPRQDAGPTVLNAATDEGQRPLSLLPQTLMGREVKGMGGGVNYF